MFKYNGSKETPEQGKAVVKNIQVPVVEDLVQEEKRVNVRPNFQPNNIQHIASPQEQKIAEQAAIMEQQVQLLQEGLDPSIPTPRFADLDFAQAVSQGKILVLKDTDNDIEYYMDVIDSFPYEDKMYTVLSPLGENKKKRKEELVIMETWRDIQSPLGLRYQSVNEGEELDRVFSVFYQRYEQAKKKV